MDSSSRMSMNPIARRGDSCSVAYIENIHDTEEIYDTILEWDFDIFAAQKVAGENTFLFLSYAICMEYFTNVAPNEVIESFIRKIQKGYIESNPYHNSLHGADVGQTMIHFIFKCGLDSLINSTLQFAAFLAGICHDVVSSHLPPKSVFFYYL
jgi:hypothetical protein